MLSKIKNKLLFGSVVLGVSLAGGAFAQFKSIGCGGTCGFPCRSDFEMIFVPVGWVGGGVLVVILLGYFVSYLLFPSNYGIQVRRKIRKVALIISIPLIIAFVVGYILYDNSFTMDK